MWLYFFVLIYIYIFMSIVIVLVNVVRLQREEQIQSRSATMCPYLQGTGTQWYSTHCYNNVHCCLSKYEFYIHGKSPVRQCNGVMCRGSFSSNFPSWEWETHFKKLGLKGQDNSKQEVFKVGWATKSCFSPGSPPFPSYISTGVAFNIRK